MLELIKTEGLTLHITKDEIKEDFEAALKSAKR